MMYSEVHKARDKQTNQLVALKRILMHNEKEGVKREIAIFVDYRVFTCLLIDTHYSYARDKNLETTLS